MKRTIVRVEVQGRRVLVVVLVVLVVLVEDASGQGGGDVAVAVEVGEGDDHRAAAAAAEEEETLDETETAASCFTNGRTEDRFHHHAVAETVHSPKQRHRLHRSSRYSHSAPPRSCSRVPRSRMSSRPGWGY